MIGSLLNRRRDRTVSPSQTALRRELGWFAAGILVLNLHIFGLSLISPQLYVPDFVASGEWWRVLTHPFVHVTWYHLLLDAGAFLFLYASLGESRFRRIAYVAGCGAGSLLLTIATMPSIATVGLCGLSGVAHGLMAIVGLDLALAQRDEEVDLRAIGWIYFSLVVAKCLWEAATGSLFLEWMHFGMTGTPMVMCHIGGVVGGVVSYGLFRWREMLVGARAQLS